MTDVLADEDTVEDINFTLRRVDDEQRREFEAEIVERFAPSLGEDTVTRVYARVFGRRGSIADLVAELTQAQVERDLSRVESVSEEQLRDRVNDEVEARLSEQHVRERVPHEGPVSEVSGARMNVHGEDLTYEEASKLYGAGKLTSVEFRPYYDEHMRRKRSW